MAVQTEELHVKFTESGSKALEQAYQRIADRVDKVSASHQNGERSFESYLKSENRVTHNVGRLAQDILRGGSATDILAAGLERIEGSFKTGFAIGIPVALAVAGITRVHEAIKEAHEAKKAFDKEIAQHPADVVGRESPNDIHEQIGKERELQREAVKKTRRRELLFPIDRSGAFINPFGENSEQINKAGDERRADVTRQFVERSQRDVDVTRQKSFGSESGGAIAEARLARDARISQIELDRNISGDKNNPESAKAKLIAQQNELFEIQNRKILEGAAAQERKLDLTEKLSKALTRDDHSDVTLAEEKLAAAKDELERLKRTAPGSDDIQARQVAVTAAESELALAKNAQQVNESSVRTADFRGTKEQEIAHALSEQLAQANLILDADKRRLAVAQARKAIEDFEKQNAVAAVSRSTNARISGIAARTAEANVDATPEQRQRNTLQSQLQSANERVGEKAVQSFANPGDKDAIAAFTLAKNEQRQAAAAIAQFEKETAFTSERELTAAKATTRELELRARGLDQQAAKVAIIAQYEERIALALHDGKDAIAAQLKQQRSTALTNQRANELQKTPQEKNEQFLQQLDRKRAVDSALTQEKGELTEEQRKSDEKFGFDKRFHPEAVPKSVLDRDVERSDRIKEIDRDLHPENTVKTGLLGEQGFRDRFHPLTQQAEQEHAEANTPEDTSNDDSGITGKIDDLISTLNELPSKVGVI
jgi:hypothetical protein